MKRLNKLEVAVDKQNVNYGESESRKYLIQKFGPKCFYCGRLFTGTMDGYQNMSVDHLESQKKGGSDATDNLVLCCKSCNSSKGGRSFSLDGNDKKLEDFQKYRKRMKIADDLWVTEHILEYSRLSKMPDSEFLIKELLRLMSKNNDNFQELDYYPRDKQWLQWKNRGVEWYFKPLGFVFQPIINKKDINENLKDVLYSKGYYPEDRTGVYKHIRPFCNPSIGIDILEQEMESIAEIFGLYNK